MKAPDGRAWQSWAPRATRPAPSSGATAASSVAGGQSTTPGEAALLAPTPVATARARSAAPCLVPFIFQLPMT